MTIVKLTLTNPQIQDIGKEAAAALPPGRRYRFYYEGNYTLADGREIATNVRALTKPKLQTRLADTYRHITKKMLTYDENVGVLLTFTSRLGGHTL
jgi:hypothetical protein